MSDLEVVEIEDCSCKLATDKALLVVMPDGDEAWIPKTQIHDDSEVYDHGHKGTLTITKWIAQQKGLLSQGVVRYVGP